MSGAWFNSSLDARLHGCHAQSLGAGRVALKARDLWPPDRGQPALISACAYVDSQGMDEITILQAEVLKTLASPRRLEILHVLARGPIEVGRLAEAIGATQPNVSQHLAVLRAAGIVEAERDGREVRYRLADPDVMVACGIMRGVLERRLTRLGDDGRPTPSRPAARSRPHQRSHRGDPMDEPLNLVLFSGTDDKLQAAAVLTAGAAALGKPVNIFLQYWALDAFRAAKIARTMASHRRRARPAGSPSMRCRGGPGDAGPRRCARPRTSVAWTSRRAACRWTCSISNRPTSTRSSTASKA